MAEELTTLWEKHQQEALPDVPTTCKGELWVLDEVIGGCVAYYLEDGQALDSRRIAILRDCRADLDRLMPDLEGPAIDYFSRLEALARLILHATAAAQKFPDGGDDE
ncbi:MAG TPA: hypothetical protein VGJ57_03005 [Nitrospirales bacterium]|jgi:hypothetical protein